MSDSDSITLTCQPEAKTCKVDDCTRVVKNKNQVLCYSHYVRWTRYGRLNYIRRKKGTGRINKDGYRTLNNKLEHRVVAEKAMGKLLPVGAVVHHVDGDKLNNAHSNLVICQDSAYHLELHRRQRALDDCGNPSYRKCARCHEYDDIGNMRSHKLAAQNVIRYLHRRKNHTCIV